METDGWKRQGCLVAVARLLTVLEVGLLAWGAWTVSTRGSVWDRAQAGRALALGEAKQAPAHESRAVAQGRQENLLPKNDAKEVKGMFLRKLLFETRAGERFLAWLERATGLAVVEADWLAAQR